METIPFYIKGIFYALVFAGFYFLMAFLRKGLVNAQFEPEQASKFIKRVFITTIVWFAVLAILSLIGFFSNFDALPPRPFFAILGSIVLMILLYRSNTFKIAAINVPLSWAPTFQFFRVPLEVMLWLMFTNSIIPVEMTFEGWNFDIIPGFLGLVIGLVVFNLNKLPLWVAQLYNVLGICTVITIVVIATLAMPTPLQQIRPDNTMVGMFPFIWLPGFLVPMAIFFHIVNLFQISQAKKRALS